MRILIIGAGPCGLGAAHRLREAGRNDWLLFDSESHVGGLSASFVDDRSFTWDVGGHVLFSHYDYFDRVVNRAVSAGFYEHLRESWVRIMGRWVPYPFQNNIRHLPDEAVEECLVGLRNPPGETCFAADFREWMATVFGTGIVRHFMEPYNRKVWGVPIETMSKEWVAERVARVDLERIERNIAEQKDDVNWGPNNRFKFPKHGGTGAIFSGIAEPLKERIHLDHEMVEVNLTAKTVTFGNGRRESYDILINTSPLDRFVACCADTPDAVREAAARLVHNGGLIVGLGFRGRRIDSKCWMYFPEENCPFYRVTNFHNYSPHNVPGGDTGTYFSLMCETTYSPWKPADPGTIIEETIDGLINAGMILPEDRQNIVSRWLIDIPYSYPVPTLERDAALAVVQPFLESKGIYSRGRFGAWKYEVGNMDHSFMQGVEVVERILLGLKERTINGAVG
jgi:protoporphyrinogen oxidase